VFGRNRSIELRFHILKIGREKEGFDLRASGAGGPAAFPAYIPSRFMKLVS
jgi:hypothetical protein